MDTDYAHFVPSDTKSARARSSGVIATRNSTSALNMGNQGSASLGTSEGSLTLTTRDAATTAVLLGEIDPSYLSRASFALEIGHLIHFSHRIIVRPQKPASGDVSH
jgi:hypothetical protein